MKISFSLHAKQRMKSRRITEEEVRLVLDKPDLTRPGNEPNRTVYERNLGRVVCVVIIDDSDPCLVVTVFSRG